MNSQARQQVQIHFGNDFAALPAERQSTAVSAVATLLGVPAVDIQLKTTHRNGIGVDFGLSTKRTEYLHNLLQANSGSLRLLGIEKVTLERASGEIQEWAVTHGKFCLENTIQPAAGAAIEAGIEEKDFRLEPRIWLFHLIYFVVTTTLSLSILQYARPVALSLLFVAVMCAIGSLLAGLKRLLAAHILAVAIGIGAPVILFGRLQPQQTIVLLALLILGVFLTRRLLF